MPGEGERNILEKQPRKKPTAISKLRLLAALALNLA